MGKIIRNGISYCAGGGDDCFRYVNDVDDENYGWIQYQLEDGTWVNYEQVKSNAYPLYMSSANEGNFVAYAGAAASISWLTLAAPNVTFGDSMNISISNAYGSVLTELVDLSEYTTLNFHHDTTSTIAADDCVLKIFIAPTKQTTMSATFSKYVYLNLTSKSENVTIDISDINGEYYIGFEICASANGWTTTTKISNMYME